MRTGNAIIQNDRDGDNCIILYGGANQAISREQVDQVLASFEAGDYLVLQNEINELSYIMEKAHEAGMKLVLNPSPMNGKIFDLPLETVDYFLLNEVECCQILGTEPQKGQDMMELAKTLWNKFPNAAVVLTVGSEGSYYVDEKKQFHQDSFRVKAVDTTAAGDTFSGYLIAGLIAGLPEEKAMELAAKAAAIAVTRPGAAPSIPSMEEVKAF